MDPQEAADRARELLESGSMRDLDPAMELAWQAHGEGVPGAGRLFATAVDRASVLQSRRQRFGTFAYDHQGDLVLAPLDGSVDDQQRLELGLGTLASMRIELDETNRARAAERATRPGLERGKPFARVWRAPTEEALLQRREAEGQPVWADGDELTFVCDRPLAGALVGPLFELPMWRVGSLLVLSVRVLRLDELVLTYGFWPLDEDGNPAFTRRPEPDGRWRGPAARPAAPTNDVLVGRLEEHDVPSGSLGRPRRTSVYLPPGPPSGPLPVVYATDGQFFAPYARRVDAAIERGEIPPCIIVASHASANRTGEYFPGFDPPTFARHERFFVEELVAWTEATFDVVADRSSRAVFGCSDGGAHALTIGLSHFNRFGHVIAYSSGLPPNGNEGWPEGEAPTVQLCAGVLEGQFYLATSAWHAFFEMTGVANHWTERVCGHELIQWIEELPAAIARAFG